MKNFFKELRKEYLSFGLFERVWFVLAAISFVACMSYFIFACPFAGASGEEYTSTPVLTATATPTPTATPTVDPEVQYRADKVTFCQDLVFYNYFKTTGITLRSTYSKYTETDTGAEVEGIAASYDERLDGLLQYKCVYGDFMGETMMLMDFDLTEVEG